MVKMRLLRTQDVAMGWVRLHVTIRNHSSCWENDFQTLTGLAAVQASDRELRLLLNKTASATSRKLDAQEDQIKNATTSLQKYQEEVNSLRKEHNKMSSETSMKLDDHEDQLSSTNTSLQRQQQEIESLKKKQDSALSSIQPLTKVTVQISMHWGGFFIFAAPKLIVVK